MSYFDHVRCPSCNAMLDPESIGGVQGRGMRCPRCNSALQLTDLFGIADAFSEDEGASLSLDDAVPGFGGDAPERAQPGKAEPLGRDRQITASAADALREMRKKK